MIAAIAFLVGVLAGGALVACWLWARAFTAGQADVVRRLLTVTNPEHWAAARDLVVELERERPTQRIARKLVPLLLAALVLGGCSTRENARAAVQADQAAQGIQRLVAAPELEAALRAEGVPPEAAATVVRHLGAICQLAGAARTSLAPVVALLGAGEPVEVDTVTPEKPEQVEAFAVAAARQAGRAEAETQRAAKARDLLSAALGIVSGQSGALAQVLSWLGLTGAGGAGLALVARGVAAFRRVRTEAQAWQETARHAVAYGEAAAAAPDDAALAVAKRAAAEAQERAGVRDRIRAVRQPLKGTA